MDKLIVNPVFGVFSPEQFEALPSDVRQRLLLGKADLEMTLRHLNEEYREGISSAWMKWLRTLLDAQEALNELEVA